MSKHLTGSADTGMEIMQNQNLFNYVYNGSEKLNENETLYKFSWSFDNYQSGYISIVVKSDGMIGESSIIGCQQNPREFSRALGAYNDPSLYDIFRIMLDHQNISHK